jgi:hypothetical protein
MSLKDKFNNLKILRKYDYDINQVVGVKGNERYILYTDKKLLRIYRDDLKGAPLINTYIPTENTIFYTLEVDKNIIDKLDDVDSFVKTRVYEEAGLDETDEYIIKHKIVDLLTDEKKVMIEIVIVSQSFVREHFEYILKESGYIDYLSFPAFSYQSLYKEKILEKANDVFVVLLDDKIFITFYSDGELIKISTIFGGLDKIFDSLSKLNIANFDMEIFKKLLKQKGVNEFKYRSQEFIVYSALIKEFQSLSHLLEENIEKVKEIYNIDHIDRIFITTKYGNVEGLGDYLSKTMNIDIFGFRFYENYNLDRLPIDPLLFLGMLETHYACLLYTSPSPRDRQKSRMPSSA